MAHHKSAIKAHKNSIRNAARNRSNESRIKTYIKHFETCVSQKKTDVAPVVFRKAVSEIMKGVTKGVLKLNTASRKVSRITKLMKTMEGATT